MVNVLYIVNDYSETSIPLEMARHMEDKDVNVKTAIFKRISSESRPQKDSSLITLESEELLDPKGVINLVRLILDYAPDIVHVHHTASAFWGSIIASILSKASVVKTEHNNQRHHTVAQNIAHAVSQYLSDQVVCNSSDTYKNLYYVQKEALGQNWQVIYNGVNESRIMEAEGNRLPEKASFHEDDLLIGSVGRLIDQKNYLSLIQSLPYVLDDCPNTQAVIVGDGYKRQRLMEEVSSLGIESNVVLTGRVSRNDVYSILHELDVFVMPSLWEGFCNAVVEAMVAGRPVVCSDISTLREVVGDTAIYVDPKNPKEIARALKQVLENENKADQLGLRAQQRARRKYSLEMSTQNYVTLYKSITPEKSCK